MSGASFIKSVTEHGIELFDRCLSTCFSPQCAGCHRAIETGNACEPCLELPILKPPFCIRCAEPTSENIGRCGSCKTRMARELFRIRSLWWLTPEVLVLWHRVKYGRRRDVAVTLKLLFQKQFERGFCPTSTLIPVPIFYRKQLERGFNQSEEVARWISRHTGEPVLVNGLLKSRATNSQAGLSRAQRLKNLRRSLYWNEKVAIPSRVLLIDDVLTTGSTLNHCAKVLARAGAKEISAWTLFRTPKWGFSS